jgi:hypothetical protein
LKMLVAIVACALIGCGYNSGIDTGYHWTSLHRTGVRTVAVPIFTSTDFTRGVEFAVTKALVNQLEATTPYKIASREKADTIIEGEIVSVRTNTVSQDIRAAIPQEQIVGIVVNFTWKDMRSGKVLVERREFQAAASYYPTLGEGRFVGRQEAAERLALAIVQELQADW